MQNMKIMFKSPRFVVGLILVMIVVLYAIFLPVFNKADPKADRKDNPSYIHSIDLREALEKKDDEAIATELEKLLAMEDDEEILQVARNVEFALEAGGIPKALSGAKQVKKSNPLYSEFDNLRVYLGEDKEIPAEEEKALAELEKLTLHHEQVVLIAKAVEEKDFEKATTLVQQQENKEEFQPLLAQLEAEEYTQAEETATTLLTQHEATFKWVEEIKVRMETGGYEEGKEALNKIQKTVLIAKDSPPSKDYWFGTDNFSRDIFLEMAYGARLSLTVGAIAGIVATFLGLTLGLLAGFVGGWLDNVINTLTNIFIVIPSMIVLILISIALGSIKEGWVTGVVIGLTAWPWTARSVRAQTTSLRYRDHVNMARITGYSTPRIIISEILPYIASYVVMAFILQVASGIMSEATLAILGLGDPTAISLGRMLNWAQQYEAIRSGRWWQFVPVAVTITMITFGLYMMNSGMDEVFNPKIRS